MTNKSKYKIGQKVKSVFNKFEEYEIVEVLRNELIVTSTTIKDGKSYRCKKGLFEVQNEN